MRSAVFATLLCPFLAASALAQSLGQPLEAQLEQAQAEQASAEAETARLEKSHRKRAARPIGFTPSKLRRRRRSMRRKPASARPMPASSRRGLRRRSPAATCPAATTGLIARRRPCDHGPASAVAGIGGSRRDRRTGQGSLATRCDFAGDPSTDGAPVIRTRPRAKTSAGGARRARRTHEEPQQSLARRQRFAELEQRSLQQALASSGQALGSGDVALAAGENVERLRGEQTNSQSIRRVADQLAARRHSAAQPVQAGRRLPAFPLRLSAAGGRAGYRGSRSGQR